MSTEDNSLSKFIEIYENYKDMVFDTAMTYCENDYHTAQEITQDVFTACFAQKIYLQKDWKKVAWLKLAVKNCYIDRWRRSQFEELQQEVINPNALENFESMDDKYIHDMEIHDRVEKSHSILNDLYCKNTRWYEYLFKFYFYDMREKEIANQDECTEEAVKSVLKRAKRWIRKHHSMEEDT